MFAADPLTAEFIIDGWRKPLEQDALAVLKDPLSTVESIRVAQGQLLAISRLDDLFRRAEAEYNRLSRKE